MTPAAPRPVDPRQAWRLHDVAATRRIEAAALATHAPHALMQRAGLGVARLALALAPHARHAWVAAGPGNNGGDGLEAAMHLRRWGGRVTVTWLGDEARASSDTAASRQRAVDAGVEFAHSPPGDADLCIDALLGIGATRPPSGRMAQWIGHMHANALPTVAVDVPTGLDVDTGRAADIVVHARATLSLLTLKPGFFTADGRDASGQVWVDDLGVQGILSPGDAGDLTGACALLAGAPALPPRRHGSHKGTWGDVVVVGGAPGMAGASLLAATAAQHAGAGRVYLAPLDPSAPSAAATQPGLMQRPPDDIDFHGKTVVCGCGGGDAVRSLLPRVLSDAHSVVLDADGLNAVATDAALRLALAGRAARGLCTVLTPHPLEAARLMGCSVGTVQGDRLRAGRTMADTLQCTVVLKGSGTIISTPGTLSHVNPTGNARLATAGTGDVLAGVVGAALAQGLPAMQAASAAAFVHGATADRWPADRAFTAWLLAQALPPLLPVAGA